MSRPLPLAKLHCRFLTRLTLREIQGTPVKGDHQVPEAWTVRLDLQEEVASPAGMVILADLELEETVEPLETLDRIVRLPP